MFEMVKGGLSFRELLKLVNSDEEFDENVAISVVLLHQEPMRKTKVSSVSAQFGR